MTDAAALIARDSGGMLASLERMGGQLRTGYRLGLEAAGLPSVDGVRAIAACGMGGSGIPGDAVRSLLGDRLGVPIVVTRGYRLPEFCHTDTLVFAVSFSGNTDEVLTAYREAAVRGCRIVAVTSGGRLAELAREEGVALVTIPDDVPAPRAAVGYLTGALLGVLEATGLGPAAGQEVAEAVRVADAAAARLGPEGADPNPALSLARTIGPRVPVVWGSEGIAEAAAQRWRTEFNENAKRPAFAAAFPELDHNEIEGWSRGAGRDFFLVILRSPSEHPSVGPRVEATLSAVSDAGLDHHEVHAEGALPLAHLVSLLQTGGFVSCYLGLEAGIDPSPIERIEAMKSRLEALE
jgi:glucose/mannose-6-phosphate isomerase